MDADSKEDIRAAEWMAQNTKAERGPIEWNNGSSCRYLRVVDLILEVLKLDGIPIDPDSPCGFASLRRRTRKAQFSLRRWSSSLRYTVNFSLLI
ncbi:unnamed protein product [Heterotrigona itama]|uniref:Uncharacterized protein n=1 Tax=Heterotrigona itama TaxID=395501 RepID=A0A6V7HJL2_9HYME|nr:unnamed protein product [Heterotrigona itama]